MVGVFLLVIRRWILIDRVEMHQFRRAFVITESLTAWRVSWVEANRQNDYQKYNRHLNRTSDGNSV